MVYLVSYPVAFNEEYQSLSTSETLGHPSIEVLAEGVAEDVLAALVTMVNDECLDTKTYFLAVIEVN